MKYVVNFSDNGEYENHCQRVWSNNDDEEINFYAYDLDGCPEDAVIGRDIFDGNDFIDVLELGFRIAKLGYDEIVINEVEWED